MSFVYDVTFIPTWHSQRIEQIHKSMDHFLFTVNHQEPK